MVPPNTVTCPYCQRLYSIYSLQHHESKCTGNPLNNRPETAENRSKRPGSAKKRRNTASATGRTRSTSSASAKRASSRLGWRSKSIENDKPMRPSTHTVTPKPSDHPTPPGERICFVCGHHYRASTIDDHVRRCESDWHGLRAGLPSHIQTNPPFSIQIPSIDGTVDVRRLDEFAAASAARAQMALCQRCKSNLSFSTALTHRCPRYEPTIEFYF